MAELNIWWEADPTERYWMEITDRLDLGQDLIAPQLDNAGHANWTYNLVTAVDADDIILHWHKDLEDLPAIVGWSRAIGIPVADQLFWQAHGSYGRQNNTDGPRPAWRMNLTDYTALQMSINQDELRREEGSLRQHHDQLRAEHTGPLYFPFNFSSKRPIRTAQGYLVKFPARLLTVFTELDDIPRPDRLRRPVVKPIASKPGRKATNTGTGYIADPKVRHALERHAVLAATDYFEKRDYKVDDVGNIRPYDLQVTKIREERRIEVKGSSTTSTTVELTHGEVDNARNNAQTDLFIVDQIEWQRERDGSVTTSGGRERVYPGWTPADADLKAIRFRYTVPTDG